MCSNYFSLPPDELKCGSVKESSRANPLTNTALRTANRSNSSAPVTGGSSSIYSTHANPLISSARLERCVCVRRMGVAAASLHRGRVVREICRTQGSVSETVCAATFFHVTTLEFIGRPAANSEE